MLFFLISSSPSSTRKHQDFQHHRLFSRDFLDHFGRPFYFFYYHSLQGSGQGWRPAHWCENQKCHYHPVSAQGPRAPNSLPGGHFCREQHRVKQPNLFSRTDHSLQVPRLVERTGSGIISGNSQEGRTMLRCLPHISVMGHNSLVPIGFAISDRSWKWKCPWEGYPVAPLSIVKP